MVTNALGFIFEGRYDVFKNVGLFENYKTLSYMGELIVNLTLGVDNKGKFLVPSYTDLEGMKSLKENTKADETDEQAVDRFINSNKSTLSDFRKIGLIVDCKLYVNEQTLEINKEKSVVRIFMPKMVKEKSGIYNQYGTEEPGIVCDEVKTINGLNTVVITEKLYQGYMKNIYSNITGENLTTRAKYLLSRMK